LTHWLEELERKENRRRRSASDSARVQDKKFRIKQNYDKNKQTYDGFIRKIFDLAERVNTLPTEHREDFGKINAKKKQTKLNNKLSYFSSSRRVQKTEFRGILNPFKTVHYKHIRVIFFNIAKVMDKIEVEIKEEYLEKKRKDGKITDDDVRHDHVKPKNDRKDKFHQIYYYDVNNLTDDFAFKIIDWLAFHENLDHLPVVHDGEKRFEDD
jgi:hypothetical protein